LAAGISAAEYRAGIMRCRVAIIDIKFAVLAATKGQIDRDGLAESAKGIKACRVARSPCQPEAVIRSCSEDGASKCGRER